MVFDFKSKQFVGIISVGIMVVLITVVLAVVLASSSSSSSEVKENELSVEKDTPVGNFVGKVSTCSHTGKQYVAYKSIPFAVPPVGEHRFTRPKPAEAKMSGQLVNSQQSKQSCWSITTKSTSRYYGEDCLYLNVFTPRDNDNDVNQSDKTEPSAVMIWLHGGGFVAGAAYEAPSKLVTQGRVIVVMVNYRLGVFGFLTTEDDSIPSNNGLWDQYLAIKWVSDNIKYFNGDPSRITVFGESAGSESTALHALSPVTGKYFQNAVLQSGASTSLLSRNARQRAKEFGDLVGCDVSNNFASCLRNVSVADILSNSKPDSFGVDGARQRLDFIWEPVVDGEMIPDEPLNLLANGSYLSSIGAYDKNYLIGILNDEGRLLTDNFMKPIPILEAIKTPFYESVTQYLLFNRYGMNQSTAREFQGVINQFYTGSEVITTEVLPITLLDLVTDLLFFIPATETALAMSQYSSSENSCFPPTGSQTKSSPLGKTYFYLFDFCQNISLDPCKSTCMPHGNDVAFELPRRPFADTTRKQLSDMFIGLLTEFAKTSEPGRAVPCGWPEYKPDSRAYLRIGPQPRVRQFLHQYRSLFWIKTFQSLLQDVAV